MLARVVAVTILCAHLMPSLTHAAEVWLSGVDPFVRHVMAPDSPSDYLDLFHDNAPWLHGAGHVAVFKTSTQYLLHAPEEDLRRMIGDLRRRRIDLGFEALMTPRHKECGMGIEGYSPPGDIGLAAQRVQKLGGTLRFAAMDEPLWFGHQDKSPTACRSSIEDLARQVAENVKALRAVFPAIRIGDIEPVAVADAPSDWLDEILQFAAAYRKATGVPLDFVHADVDWHGNWLVVLPALAGRLRTAGIRFGIIYNGDPTDDEDTGWTTHAEERFEELEGTLGLAPDDAILQTWMRHPLHFLPETEFGTMTNLVLSYVRPVTRISIRRVGSRIVGALTDARGRPLNHMAIAILRIDPNRATHPLPRTVTGIVRQDAASALIGLRMDTECQCSGHGEILLGVAHYQEDGGADIMRQPVRGPPGEPQRLRAQPDRPLNANSPPFPVTPNSHFRLWVPMDATADMADSGYLALIFLDVRGKEVQRLKITPTPSAIPWRTETTDAAGRVEVPLADEASTGLEIHIEFAGTNKLRGTRATARD